MSVRVPDDQSAARLWGVIEADIDRLERTSMPAPLLYTPGTVTRATRAKPEPPPPTVADRLAALSVGERRVVYSVQEPTGWMRRAKTLADGDWSARKLAPNKWEVERVA